jgi:hypothetical protein
VRASALRLRPFDFLRDMHSVSKIESTINTFSLNVFIGVLKGIMRIVYNDMSLLVR